jgi:hypothetical protein
LVAKTKNHFYKNPNIDLVYKIRGLYLFKGSIMAQSMGLGIGISGPDVCFKRKNRWLLKIDGVSAQGINALPPSKAGRPSLSIKELEMQHITETVYFPGKIEWKPITLTLYDTKQNENPILKWLSSIYDVKNESRYKYTVGFKKDRAVLELYDGCGNVIESWVMEAVWPTSIEFGELDMSMSEVVTVDVTLRYDRAYTTI